VKLIPVKSGGSAKIIKLKTLTILETTKSWDISSTSSIKLTKSQHKFDLKLGTSEYPFVI
jgi:hypothetical protein